MLRSLSRLILVPAFFLCVNLVSAQSIKSISIETGRADKGALTLAGRDSSQQLLVTGVSSDGKQIDLTRAAKYAASPSDIVTVEDSGWVYSQKEGTATIKVTAAKKTAEITVRVANIVEDLPINFANEVVPIFTRFGCNSGGCHGKSGGQNHFQLSLLGFEPAEDFEYLVLESRGRRILPAAPDYSLLLRKASGDMAHGGGVKFRKDSAAYRVLRRWIQQGMPYGKADDPTVTRIEMVPHERILDHNAKQQLVVVAHYSDGSTKDVTRLAQFESNNKEMATVSETGLVETKTIPGVVSIMARFQATVSVFRGTIPLGQMVGDLPKPKNFIDDLVFDQLKKLGLPVSKTCDDATFLRRASIDIAGRLPTLEETKAFLDDKSKNKREELVDRLLDSKDYAFYFANKWSNVLRNKRKDPKEDIKPTQAFHGWIVDSLHKNKPYDRFVQEIITATGKEVSNPPVTWYHEVKDTSSQVEDVAQLFLGQRIECARCHHHPFEKWSQKDYYGFSAFFSRVKYKDPPRPKNKRKRKKKKGKNNSRYLTEIFHQQGVAKAVHPRTKEDVLPAGLGSQPMKLPEKSDPRKALAEWMTAPKNPYFARTLVNRYWKHFFGRGLVDPEDDMRVTNPPTNPELLSALEKHFIKNKYDLKDLVRTICNSQVYQLSSLTNKYNKDDSQSFSHFYPRRLTAEVLYDAIDQVTKTQPRFRGVPAGTRAVELPDNAFDSYFLSVLGKPSASSACECERNNDINLAQLLHLLNSPEVQKKTSGGMAQTLSKDRRPHEEKINELFLVALSRRATEQEIRLAAQYIERNPREGYPDLIWALINTQEFLFNH